MDDKTTALIEKLAEKFGTTAEHLWGVLLHQAPISGAVSLVGVALMIVSAFFMVRFVKEKTTAPAGPEDGRTRRAKWVDADAILAWAVTGVYIMAVAMTVFFSAQGIVAAFFNPEYWALSHILGR